MVVIVVAQTYPEISPDSTFEKSFAAVEENGSRSKRTSKTTLVSNKILKDISPRDIYDSLFYLLLPPWANPLMTGQVVWIPMFLFPPAVLDQFMWNQREARRYNRCIVKISETGYHIRHEIERVEDVEERKGGGCDCPPRNCLVPAGNVIPDQSDQQDRFADELP